MSLEIEVEKVKKSIESFSPKNYSIILVFPIILLIFGFVIWSIYLFGFGFQEDEILKVKYILCGTSFLLLTVFIWTIFKIIFKLILLICKKTLQINRLNKVKKNIENFNNSFKDKNKFINFFYTILFLVWLLVVYPLIIFPIIPFAFGGGQPRAVSLIASKETMPILNSLEIGKADGANYQTINICVVHENSHDILVLREDRILMLEKSLFQGYGKLPDRGSVVEQMCVALAKGWSRQGIFFNSLLFETNILNLFRNMLGYQERGYYLGY